MEKNDAEESRTAFYAPWKTTDDNGGLFDVPMEQRQKAWNTPQVLGDRLLVRFA